MTPGNGSTKQAILPNGETLHFPLDTPDEHVHAQVRAKMGMPPPEPPMDPAIMAQQQTGMLLQGAQQSSERLTQSTAALHQQLGALMQTLQRTMTTMATVNQTAVQAIAAANNAVAQSVARLSNVADQMAAATAEASMGVRAANQRVEVAVGETKAAIGALGERFDQASATIAQAVTMPKKAVKGKDGTWRSEPC